MTRLSCTSLVSAWPSLCRLPSDCAAVLQVCWRTCRRRRWRCSGGPTRTARGWRSTPAWTTRACTAPWCSCSTSYRCCSTECTVRDGELCIPRPIIGIWKIPQCTAARTRMFYPCQWQATPSDQLNIHRIWWQLPYVLYRLEQDPYINCKNNLRWYFYLLDIKNIVQKKEPLHNCL